MEIVFLLISITITLLLIFGVGISFYSPKQLLIEFETNDILIITHLLFGAILICTFFMTLCGLNNTFWLLPYLNK